LRARLFGSIWFCTATALPVLAWHDTAARLGSRFRIYLGYLVSAWSGFALIALGLVCFVPVLVSIGRNPDSRLYPRNRGALIGWGASLYLLGLALSVQISQLASLT
jgi:hypothetical protein